MEMDPSMSVCRLHPGVAVTGFCPACIRDRLAGLQPAAADLRRCKSFSYARSAVAVEPHRRSCDLSRHDGSHGDHHQQQPPKKSSSSLGGLLGKKLQQWRRKGRKEPPGPTSSRPAGTEELPGWHRRPSCDAAGPGRAPRSRDPRLEHLPVEDDDDEDSMGMGMAVPMPRSDGQIPVEEEQDYCSNYYDYKSVRVPVPGGCVQTRDYYLDSSSSGSRRRRSVDRSDANEAAACRMSACRVSPAIAADAERPPPLYQNHHHHHYHHRSVHVRHQYYSREGEGEDEEELQLQEGAHNHNLRRADDDFSGSFRTCNNGVPASKANKKGFKGWSIWGLMSSKKSSSSSSNRTTTTKSSASAEAAAGASRAYDQPWPELRARGYDGQMLRCNSSISARSSFSGGIGGNLSGRRSVSGVDMRDAAANNGGVFRGRRDEVLLSSTRSGRHHHELDPAMAAPQTTMRVGMLQYQLSSSRPPSTSIIPRRSSSNSKHEFATTRRSTLGWTLE